MNTLKLNTITIILLTAITLSAKDFKASLFGVKSDGITLNTRSIQKSIDFISESGGGRLVFYVGRYLTGTIQLKSNVTIQLEEGAVLVGSTSAYDYLGAKGTKALIYAYEQQNIGITGKGVIEGQGAALLNNINVQIQKGYLKETEAQARPALMVMNKCTNVTIDQINLMNACGNVQSFIECKNISVSGVTFKSKATKDSKGILWTGCEGVRLINLFVETSGTEFGSSGTSKNVSIINCKNSDGKKLNEQKSELKNESAIR